MSRKVYDDYSYIDPDNLYTYSGTSVLRNNFDERDAEKARELEYKIVASQSMKLFFNPIEIRSTLDILRYLGSSSLSF
jgi:cell filamentation protein